MPIQSSDFRHRRRAGAYQSITVASATGNSAWVWRKVSLEPTIWQMPVSLHAEMWDRPAEMTVWAAVADRFALNAARCGGAATAISFQRQCGTIN